MIPGLTGEQIKSLADFLASLDASYAPCLENGRIEVLMGAMAESKASLDGVQSPEILLKGAGGGRPHDPAASGAVQAAIHAPAPVFLKSPYISRHI